MEATVLLPCTAALRVVSATCFLAYPTTMGLWEPPDPKPLSFCYVMLPENFFYCSFYAKSRVVILQLSMGSRSRISAHPLVGARQQIDRRWPGQDDPSPPGLLFTERSVFPPPQNQQA
jgi:hypothetical protein